MGTTFVPGHLAILFSLGTSVYLPEDDQNACIFVLTTPPFRLLRWLSGKESTCQCRRPGFCLWVGQIPWRRKWQPTPVFLPGKSHGQRSQMGCSPWGRKRVGHNLVTKQRKDTIHLLFYTILSFLLSFFLSPTMVKNDP